MSIEAFIFADPTSSSSRFIASDEAFRLLLSVLIDRYNVTLEILGYGKSPLTALQLIVITNPAYPGGTG
jgi:hypothetical protein